MAKSSSPTSSRPPHGSAAREMEKWWISSQAPPQHQRHPEDDRGTDGGGRPEGCRRLSPRARLGDDRAQGFETCTDHPTGGHGREGHPGGICLPGNASCGIGVPRKEGAGKGAHGLRTCVPLESKGVGPKPSRGTIIPVGIWRARDAQGDQVTSTRRTQDTGACQKTRSRMLLRITPEDHTRCRIRMSSRSRKRRSAVRGKRRGEPYLP